MRNSDDLRQILECFFPLEQEIDRKKDTSWKEIPKKWQKWIEDHYAELPELIETPESLAKEFSNSLLWPIWREDERLINQNYSRGFEAHFLRGKDEEKFFESKKYMFEEILRIVEEEWHPIKEEYEKLHEELKNLITSKILPRIDNTLRGLGE